MKSDIPNAVDWALRHERVIPDEAVRREVRAILENSDHPQDLGRQYVWTRIPRPIYNSRAHAATMWRLLDRIAELEAIIAENLTGANYE